MKMKNLKWLVGLFLIGICMVSCLDDEPVMNVTYQYRPIDSIQIDSIYPARQVTEIKTFFTTTNGCQQFFDYDYTILGNERTVSVITSEIQDGGCTEITESKSFVLKFNPASSGTYTFRFWNGKDADGQDTFIIREIVVPQ
ncbi:hypothetical protein SAMN06296427_104248 [Moheibacter sediminis]|uniref:DUF3872 domain-containing protein n=2 Tax=Moheibacter sediminis TaxID=1434700 RepID=A0A1W2AKJ9_9FLAO|nr:hypothetical protein SAMN06296427_104248 [Moheibacter sediminis]